MAIFGYLSLIRLNCPLIAITSEAPRKGFNLIIFFFVICGVLYGSDPDSLWMIN